MGTGHPTRRLPLDRFPLVRTSSVEELQQAYASAYASSRIELTSDSRSFAALFNGRKLTNIELNFASFDADLRLNLPYPNLITQSFVVRGGGEIMTQRAVLPMHAGVIGLITPEEHHKLRIVGEYERLNVALKPGPLAKKLSALIDAPVDKPLHFRPIDGRTSAALQGLQRLVSYFATQLNDDEAVLPDLMQAELEQATMTAFLCANLHSYSHLLERKPPAVAPWQVRLAEGYIEANWNRAIAIEDIVKVTGASARSIYRTFKLSRGCSPMQFVKQLRLREAQRMLTSSHSMNTVTDIALACGFGDLGRFGRDYRAAFGELPSMALNRAKGIRAMRQ